MNITAKQAIIIISFLCFSLLFCSCDAPRESQQPKENKTPRYAKTIEYLEEWSNRPSYPDSVSFAYYNIYSLKTLGKVDQQTRKKVIGFIKSCQNQDGGFLSSPMPQSESSLLSTYFALNTLDALEAKDRIDREAATSYILSLVQENGSIRASSKDSFESLVTTYYGISALDLLDSLNQLDRAKTISYIMLYKEKNKGFSIASRGISVPQSTAMAVRSLLLLNGLEPDIKRDSIAFLKETRYSGLVDAKYTTQQTIKDLSYVLEALFDLEAINEVDTDKMLKFVESLYISQNGGFAPEPMMGASPPSTYYSILCLKILGKLD